MRQPPSPKLLLIAHEASRSGAPVLLLTFARWLKANSEVPFDILLLRDGPLRQEFAALAHTMVADELSGKHRFVSRVMRRLSYNGNDHWNGRTFDKLVQRGYTIVLGNSIVCLPWLARFKASTAARCVCAVHELTFTIERFFDRPYVSTTLPTMDRVIAGSHAVRNNLIASYSIPASLVEVVHSFVTDDAPLRRDRATLRRELGIDPAEVVIGGVGNCELRKGVDLLAPLALALTACNPERRFRIVWLGSKPGDELVSLSKRDASLLGVGQHVIFVDANPDANDYVDLCDVFILPSREDPFPLVVLTAIRMGKPVVAFERSGGMDELLIDGAGCLVPYLDVSRFAEAIEHLLADPQDATQIARIAKARVVESYGVDRLARRLWEGILPKSPPLKLAPLSEPERLSP